MTDDITDREFRDAVRDSKSYSEVIRRLNRATSGASLKHTKDRISRLSLDTSHFSYNFGRNFGASKASPDEILVLHPDNRRVKSPRLREALLSTGRK